MTFNSIVKFFMIWEFNQKYYLNPIAACHINANNKKKTGTIGNTSIIGPKATQASGRRDKSKLSINNTVIGKKLVKLNLIHLILIILV